MRQFKSQKRIRNGLRGWSREARQGSGFPKEQISLKKILKDSFDLVQDYEKTGFLDVVARRSKVNLVQVKSREESSENSNESYCYFLLYCSLCYAKYLESE